VWLKVAFGFLLLSVASCQSVLNFNSEGNFKIVQFADIHYHNGNEAEQTCSDLTALQSLWPCSDLNTTHFMELVLDAEKPDFVVFTGDNIDGGADNASLSIQLAFKPVVDRGLKFAAVFGNHDEESNLPRSELMDAVNAVPGSLSLVGPSSIHGYGNYYLKLQDQTTTKFHLYFVDSGDYSQYAQVDGYDWIWPDQIAWFLELSNSLKEENDNLTLPALAFFHIPLPEYSTMLQSVDITGDYQESVCSANVNSGFHTAFLETGDVKATFVGHDHVNDYCGDYLGINLCYGGGVGYSTYGKAGWPRRSRIIQINNYGESVTTWKRLDDGDLTIKDEQVLWSAE